MTQEENGLIVETDPVLSKPEPARQLPSVLPISDVTVRERSRKDMGDIEGLAASIGHLGLLQPVVVRPDGVLVAGQRRLLACMRLGWETVPVHVADGLEDVIRFIEAEMAENIEHLHYKPSEAVHAARRIREPIEEENRRRQVEAGSAQGEYGADGGRGNRKETPSAESAEGVSDGRGERETRSRVAAAVGLKRDRLVKAEAVVAAAEREPEKFGKLVAQMDRTGKVHGAYKQMLKLQAVEQIAAEPPPLPEGPFHVIVADPPWSYAKSPDDITHRGSCPYPSMTLEQIKAMPVARMAHDDCLLWLWTTNAHMRDAFGVLDAWGFTPKTILTWVKDHFGTGDWLRGQTEHCLLAVRGKPTVQLTNQTTVIHGPLREHSRKPEEFYALVEALCPGSKVELFAREQRQGWAQHGNEI